MQFKERSGRWRRAARCRFDPREPRSQALTGMTFEARRHELFFDQVELRVQARERQDWSVGQERAAPQRAGDGGGALISRKSMNGRASKKQGAEVPNLVELVV